MGVAEDGVAQDGIVDTLNIGSVTGWQLLLAASVLLVSWLLARSFGRGVVRLAGQIDGISTDLGSLAGRVVRYFVLLLGAGVALSILGAPIQPLLAAAIIVAVAIFLVLRGIADNFAAGLVIQTRQPMHIGDEIETLGSTGIVTELSGRAVIRTADGRTVHIPNAEVLQNPLINNSAAGGCRAEVQVRADAAASRLRDDLLAAAADAPGVLARPSPDVIFTAVEPGRITAHVQFWHAPGERASVASAVIAAVAERLRREGVAAAIIARPPPPPRTPPGPL